MFLRQPFFFIFILYWVVGLYLLKASKGLSFSILKSLSFNYKILSVEIILLGLSSCFYVLGRMESMFSLQSRTTLIQFELLTDLILIIIFIWYFIKDDGLVFSYPFYRLLKGKDKYEEFLNKKYGQE